MNDSTYSSIIETLDVIGAPPGEMIAGRILALRQELLDATARAVVAEREHTIEAERAAATALVRADAAEYALKSANESNAKLLREIDELRTQVARLSAQLDYATKLLLSPMPLEVP